MAGGERSMEGEFSKKGMERGLGSNLTAIMFFQWIICYSWLKIVSSYKLKINLDSIKFF